MTGYYESGIRMAKRTYSRTGLVRWYDDEGFYHRVDGPALVWAHGRQLWYSRGMPHFAHGPADLWPSGTLVWYEDGRHLRERHLYG